MATYNEFLIDAGNCLSYHGSMYSRLIRQGTDDKCLKALLNFEAICLDIINRSISTDIFTIDEIRNFSIAFKRLCNNPELRLIGTDVTFLPSQIYLNVPSIVDTTNTQITVVNTTYYIMQPGDIILLVDTSQHETTIVIPTTYLQTLKSIDDLVIKDKTGNADVNAITIITENGELIDGETNFVIDHPYMAINLTSDEVNYFII